MEKIKIQGTANSDKIEYGTAEIRTYSPRDVLQKVLKTLALYWGIAIFCVFLPVVHFVLVPLFFFLGIFMAMRARKFKGEILSGEILCPNCSQKVTLSKASILWPNSEICQSCASVVRFLPAESSNQ
jgi:hypothetical protein